jgi:hypothetical protein
LKCLEFLFEKRCPWDENTFKYVAFNGHLECLEFLFEKKCPWNEKTFEAAVKNGNLKCLEFLFEKKCPWNEKTFKTAVENEKFECIKYLYKNNFPWNKEECLKIAIEKKNLIIITFIENLLKDEVSNDSELSLRCGICCVNIISTVYIPCGHVSSCLSCAKQMTNCPHCRMKNISYSQIFLK